MWLLTVLLLADTSRAFSMALAPAESLWVTVEGAGDPVVLIPGLFGSAFGYRRVLPGLVDAGYRTIVIEPLGIGSSARPEHADYSLTAQADRVAAALDRLPARVSAARSGSRGRVTRRRPRRGRDDPRLPSGDPARAVDQAVRRRTIGPSQGPARPDRRIRRYDVGDRSGRRRLHGRGRARSRWDAQGLSGDGPGARGRAARAAPRGDPLPGAPRCGHPRARVRREPGGGGHARRSAPLVRRGHRARRGPLHL